MSSFASPSRLSRFRFFLVAVWITSLGVSFLAGAIAFRQRQQIRQFIGTAIRGRVIESNLYNIAVKTVAIPGEGRDGGIDALEDGLLLANRLGAMWFVTAARELQPLSLRIPVNVEEFENDSYNKTLSLPDQFGVKDILVQRLGSGIRLLGLVELSVLRQRLLRASRLKCENNRGGNPQRSRHAPARLADAV